MRLLPRASAALIVVLLLLPLARQTIPAILGTFRSAIQLLRLTRAERRAIVLGSWTLASAELSRRLPPHASVDLVVADPRAVELAPFLAADLAPRPTWCYDGWAGWRARVPLRFVRDARAVNTAAPPPLRADVVVLIDTRRDPPVLQMDPTALSTQGTQ